jgi:diguanylate cyclase (GGDEF)-like protein
LAADGVDHDRLLEVIRQSEDHDGQRAAAVAANGLGSLIALPVLIGADVGGVIEFFTGDAGEPGADLVLALEQVGAGLGRVLERERATLALAANEQRLEHLLLHDALTGCPNRSLFATELQRALTREGRCHRGLAVLAIDLDRFQSINERYGHDVGDAVLVEVAERITNALRAYDTVSRPGPIVSRLGGDEFMAVCEDVGSSSVAVAAIGRRVAAAIAEPLRVGGQAIVVTAAVGIAISRGGAIDADLLLLHAETAMQQVKGEADANVQLFEEEVREAVDRHHREVIDLRGAIEHGQLRLLYQPKVDIASGQVHGVEALVRWEHPTRGLLAPVEFISLAEESGLIASLGEWVLVEACRQQAEWTKLLGAHAPPMVAVNVSGRQFVPGFVDVVRRAVAETGVVPESLGVEITESVMMGDVEAAVEIVHELKALGLLVAVDDFGTGYSSLSHIKRFPIDELKIDKSFVDGLGTDPEDTAIVAAVVAMAQALGLMVIAEGVETSDQLGRLRHLGCEMVQGYVYSRPVRPDDLVALGSVLRPHDDERSAPASASVPEVVLIVDDTADVRQLANVSLSTSGFEVLEARTGDEALRQARRARPACVVLDVSMPGLDGFQVCRALRSDPLTTATAIVMLTSRAAAGDKIAAFSAGADDYMVKPFAPRELVSRIRQAIARRAASPPSG